MLSIPCVFVVDNRGIFHMGLKMSIVPPRGSPRLVFFLGVPYVVRKGFCISFIACGHLGCCLLRSVLIVFWFFRDVRVSFSLICRVLVCIRCVSFECSPVEGLLFGASFWWKFLIVSFDTCVLFFGAFCFSSSFAGELF